jgi:hypothetical protein
MRYALPVPESDLVRSTLLWRFYTGLLHFSTTLPPGKVWPCQLGAFLEGALSPHEMSGQTHLA